MPAKSKFHVFNLYLFFLQDQEGNHSFDQMKDTLKWKAGGSSASLKKNPIALHDCQDVKHNKKYSFFLLWNGKQEAVEQVWRRTAPHVLHLTFWLSRSPTSKRWLTLLLRWSVNIVMLVIKFMGVIVAVTIIKLDVISVVLACCAHGHMTFFPLVTVDKKT